MLSLSPWRRRDARSFTLSASGFLFTAALSSGCGFFADSGPAPFDPHEATLADVQLQVKSGAMSCQSLVTAYTEFHQSLDPQLRAIVTWNEQVSADADRLDQIPVSDRGPLHCVPIVVKDNIDVIGLPTTGGAQALSTSIPPDNADVVGALLSAGAIVLGKTNMSDFAYDGTSTVSSYAGQTLNPYNSALTIYGSSGGSAAAVTESLGVIGLGTDTYGSLVQPASATALVAIRPTQGLISSQGILPLMSLQDSPGPMMRTVEDAATVLELLVNQELSDLGPQNYTQVLSRNGLQGLTVGFDPTALQLATMPQLIPSQDVSDLFTQALAQIQQAGATTKQVNALTTLLPSLEQVTDLSFQCMPVDFKQSINSYLGGLGPNEPIQSLSGLIANGQFLNTVSSFLNQAQASTDTIASSSACQQYISAKAAAAGAIVSFLDSQGLDLLVYPAANQPPYPIGTPPAGWYGFQALSSPTGLPSLTMPMGIAAQSGAPVGLIFLARSYQESKLVQAAYALQEQLHPRTPPLLPM